MAIEKTKNQLVGIVSDHENKVIALSGKWGTGKTHLIGEILSAATDEKVKGALKASLFGLRDMQAVKLKLLQAALPSADKKSTQWKAATDVLRAVRTVLVNVNGGFTAVDELTMLAVPSILKNRVIVLDDIERKHPDLSIDEVLGFIDEFTQQHDTRFVLVLNSDQLQDQEIWRTLSEKVVDHEVRLETSPDEAFEIAKGLVPTRFPEPIRRSVRACGVTNVRIIRKILKVVNLILGARIDLSDAVLARVIPSAVVLAATHYKGIENGPTTEYILARGRLYTLEDEDDVVLQKQKSDTRWDNLLIDLGIVSCDEYELLVVDFLRSGLIDSAGIETVVERYIDEQEGLVARERSNGFLKSVYWDHRLSEAELIEHATQLVAVVPRLDASFVSSIADAVGKLPGGVAVSDAMIAAWIGAMPADLELSPDEEFVFQRSLDPRIKQAIDGNAARAQAAVTVLDVCNRIFESSSWGVREELAMKGASQGDFEGAIRGIEDPAKFRTFIRKMLDFTRNKGQYERHFGSAMDNFASACRHIVASADSPRLSAILRGAFAGAGLASLLENEEAPAANH